MYRLLIVDDEVEIVEGLKTLIDWERHGIELCGDAGNGAAAFAMIQELSPDIIIMDIRMPVISGLELLEKISAHNIKIKSIILSGYDDFYYAQTAINLKAANYLLKPCRPDDILGAVLKVTAILDAEKSQEMILYNYKQQFQENLPVLKEKLLREIIHGRQIDRQILSSKMQLYDVNIPAENLLVNLIQIDLINSLYEKHGSLDVEAMKMAITHMVYSAYSPDFHNEILQNGEDIIVVLSPRQQFDSLNKLINCAEAVREQIQQSLPITATIGIGSLVAGIEDLWISYKEAGSAVEAKFYLGDNRVIVFSDIALTNFQTATYPLNEELAIINCLRTGNNAAIKGKVESFYQNLNISGIPSKKYLQRATVALIGRIYQFCLENNLDTSSILGEEFKFFTSIEACETKMELQEKIIFVLNTVLNKAAEKEKTNILIKYAIDFIKDNHFKDITLDTVAKQIFITPGYLSQLFKQETGINFLEYLNQYRIQKAKELLKNPFLKNYEISNKVGFGDEKYFSQVFKRYTGLTPTQYKESSNI